MPDRLEEEVTRLLPCHDRRAIAFCRASEGEPHIWTCPARYRPAVLAALRKQREANHGDCDKVIAKFKTRLDEVADERNELRRQLAEAKAERDELRDAFDYSMKASGGRSTRKLLEVIAHLEAALAKIAAWDLPRIFDKELEREVAYCVMYGSNGEREFVRKLAREALVATGGKPE